MSGKRYAFTFSCSDCCKPVLRVVVDEETAQKIALEHNLPWPAEFAEAINEAWDIEYERVDPPVEGSPGLMPVPTTLVLARSTEEDDVTKSRQLVGAFFFGLIR